MRHFNQLRNMEHGATLSVTPATLPGIQATIQQPGPSNRSPPATFKSPKATISETCRVGCWSLNPPTTLLCSSFGALRNPRRSHARRVHAFGLFTVSAGSTSHGPPRRDVTEGCAAPRRSLAQTVSACHTTPTSISILLTGACSTD